MSSLDALARRSGSAGRARGEDARGAGGRANRTEFPMAKRRVAGLWAERLCACCLPRAYPRSKIRDSEEVVFPQRLENVGGTWCRRAGLNCRPQPYQGCALPLSYGGDEAGAIAKPWAGGKPQYAETALDLWSVSPHPRFRWEKTTKPPQTNAKPSWRRRCAPTCAGARLRRNRRKSRRRARTIRTRCRDGPPAFRRAGRAIDSAQRAGRRGDRALGPVEGHVWIASPSPAAHG